MIRCKHCAANLGETCGADPATARDLYSEKCLCRLTVDTLEGLLAGKLDALRTFREHTRRWLLAQGRTERDADNLITLMKFHYPLNGGPQYAVRRAIDWHQDQREKTS